MDAVSTHPFVYGKLGFLPVGNAFEHHAALRAYRGPLPHTPPATTTLGHDVWIGDAVIIKNGVTIGTGAVIGAGSVVTKDVAPYTVVAGNPARVIRARFPEPIAEALLARRWWRLAPWDLARYDLARPRHAADAVRTDIEAGTAQPYVASAVTLAEVRGG